MSHSLIGADGRTHCKIVAVAAAGAFALVLVGLTAQTPASGVVVVQAPGQGSTLRAAVSESDLAVDATAIR